MTLRILPATLVNQIAAGEVIERPASVVKELIENAIDAGALQIEIFTERAGILSIIVQDDGAGMTKEELALAVQRHATSKLPDDDLDHIHTLGFRGEALPSIGSVSRLRIQSRTAQAENAWEIRVEAGNVTPPQPASAQKGTRVEVRDLFYATPARLKFLKSERTEAQHVEDVILRLAMAHPHIGFRWQSEGKESLHLLAQPATLHAADAFVARAHALLGKEFAQHSLVAQSEREGARLLSIAGLPTLHRATASMQYWFVNGRMVREKWLSGCLRAAYQGLLAHDRHPVVVLFLDIAPHEIDVNVHPAKAEVRFRDVSFVRGMMISALRAALSQVGFRSANPQLPHTLEKITGGASHAYAYANSSPPSVSEHVTAASYQAQILPMHLPPQGAAFAPSQEPDHTAAPLTEYPLGVARGQLHQTYIIAETADGVVIVDQHAAHERIVMERMKEQVRSRNVQRQRLLLPEIVNLPPHELAHLLSHTQALEEYGLVVEPFGQDAVVVREIPAATGPLNVPELIRSLAEQLGEHGQWLALSEKIDHVCATLACHRSIRAGHTLSLEEMNAMLRQIEQTPNSGQCNHGRPTYVTLTLPALERLFGRH